jgi:DNA-binding transcriptional LysR family regulator
MIDPSLDDIRLFIAVAQDGGFAPAARRLGVPLSTVSRRVAVLETVLGVQLFRRTTRTVRLTEEGSAFAERCAGVVSSIFRTFEVG